MASVATSIAWNRKLAIAVVRRRVILTCLYRPLDGLAIFETACENGSTTAPARYAIRQALDQEYQKYVLRQRADARQARYKAGGVLGSEADLGADGKENASIEEGGAKLKPAATKRDFFGRVVHVAPPAAECQSSQGESQASQISKSDEKWKERKVWVSFHEGFSNAVRKPITLDELMRGF